MMRILVLLWERDDMSVAFGSVNNCGKNGDPAAADYDAIQSTCIECVRQQWLLCDGSFLSFFLSFFFFPQGD